MNDLRQVLELLEDAHGITTVMRPDPAREQVRERIARAVAILRATVDPADWTAGEEVDMPTRRTLLAALLAGAVAPREALDRLLATTRPGTADAAAYGGLLTAYADAYHRTPPAALQRAVGIVLDRITDQQAAARSNAARGQLARLAAETAAFAGQLAYDLGQTGSARAHMTLAATTARDTGDQALWALALALDGATASPGPDGGPGDLPRARALLAQATTLLPTEAGPHAATWAHAHAASKAAIGGDAPAFNEHLERSQEANEALAGSEPRSGFFTPTGYFSPLAADDYLYDYRGTGLARLGSHAAFDVLNAVHTDEPRRRAVVARNLMELYIRAGDYDAAAAAGLRSLAAADAGGLKRHRNSLSGVRSRAPQAPAFAELDEALRG